MKPTFTDEKHLIAHLIKGNEAAYAHLVEVYYKPLCNYVANLSKDDFKSEDIVQNVILRFWEQRKNLNVNVSLKSLLYRSVYNEFVDQYRKDIAITALEKKYIEELDLFYDTHDEADTNRLMVLVQKEIEQLPPKCKEVFLLSKKEGLTYNEIAEFKNISVKTVDKHVSKAYTLLREKMKTKINHMLFLLFGVKAKG